MKPPLPNPKEIKSPQGVTTNYELNHITTMHQFGVSAIRSMSEYYEFFQYPGHLNPNRLVSI